MQWNPGSAETSGRYPIDFRRAKISVTASGLPSCWMWKFKAKDACKDAALLGSPELGPSERAKVVKLL